MARSLKEQAQLLSEWLQKCNQLHGNKCHVSTPIAERSPQHIPDWVIDTEQSCIVPGKAVNKYAALSYVWSSPVDSSNLTATHRLLLRRETLKDLKKPGFLSSYSVSKQLPMVVRDSMTLVLQSGTRYLWVDCLCVIQHDESTTDKMAFLPEIYSGAFFTIIAASEANGLRGSIVDVQSPAQRISLNTLHDELLASHWASRGWTFQEHILSKRSIIFLDEKLFWDCSVAWDSRQMSLEVRAPRKGQAPTPILNKIHKYRELSRQLASLSSPDLNLYIEMVCRYNHRDLTYEQDALPAFSGVLDALTRGFHDGFISGLPSLFLDSALLWQPLSRAKRRVATPFVQNLAPPSPLPSWSWVGWQCVLDPASLKGCLNYEAHVSSDDDSSSEPISRRTINLVQWQTMDNPFRGGRPVVWFRQASRDGIYYRYPSPMADILSVKARSESIPFLSCTTTTAELRIRRVLWPCARIKPRQYESATSVSVFDTFLYKNDPEVDTCCPVITLEDGKGRWAGVMRVMDDIPELAATQFIDIVAISRGDCSYFDAASTYEATIDRMGCYRFKSSNGDHFYFDSSTSTQADKTPETSSWPLPCSPVVTENRQSGRDQGPLFPIDGCGTHSGYGKELPENWRYKFYDFYNVLWVQTINGIMYRKAAGRVSKDIWETSCGPPRKIVLG
ncbi:hypothetical protein J7T55_014819 [Diaporthe amygdali]|uniref:uncharacterized protein n=1 Tax=Phomopsis amygdali TaxID=1214568 RepID=UPI0022FDBC78|nr:uncharacterized protein J7T55_014819 [Diaporthe amygdali]KAJ0110016.1 hypothetical protein J7T55_014819 [Diaporthe amygdali]